MQEVRISHNEVKKPHCLKRLLFDNSWKQKYPMVKILFSLSTIFTKEYSRKMNYSNKKVSSPHVDFVDVLKANAIVNIFIQTWVHRACKN
jgi:hypothetical protein